MEEAIECPQDTLPSPVVPAKHFIRIRGSIVLINSKKLYMRSTKSGQELAGAAVADKLQL